jgi:murein peptide amidase A
VELVGVGPEVDVGQGRPGLRLERRRAVEFPVEDLVPFLRPPIVALVEVHRFVELGRLHFEGRRGSRTAVEAGDVQSFIRIRTSVWGDDLDDGELVRAVDVDDRALVGIEQRIEHGNSRVARVFIARISSFVNKNLDFFAKLWPNHEMISLVAPALPLFLALGMSWVFLPNVPVVEAPDSGPAVVKQKVVGVSEMGRDIVGYEMGGGVNCLLLFGGIHGNERGTVDLLGRLVAEIENHPEILSADKKLMVIPLVNPDGYFERGDKLNANAVNLNRNFATQNWVVQAGDEETYAGPQPFSENESRALREVIQACDPSLMIAYHSQGALVSPESNDASLALANWYAAHTGYEYFDEWDYSGTATGWFVEATDGAAITVELTSHTESDWEINKQALLELLAR